MTFLSPAQYNQAEQEGLAPLCCRAIECFRPSQFAAVGFPFSIHSMSELWRYTEAMHEGIGLSQPMEEYLMTTLLAGGLTEQEIEEAKRVKQALDDLARSIGRPVEYPVYSMLLAFNQARHISCLAAPGSTIVEMGGGAGYLGTLLVMRGYRYIATDVSQALYILQSNLLARVAAAGSIDLVDTQYGADELRTLKPGQAAMVPWWRWALRSTRAGLSIDLATSNHNLLEMHQRSRPYHMAAVREHLSPDGCGFVFEGWGDPSRQPRWMAVKDFTDHGFDLLHNDIRIVYFAPRERQVAGTVMRYPLSLDDRAPSRRGTAGATPIARSGRAGGGVASGSAASFWERVRRRLLSSKSHAGAEPGLSAIEDELLATRAELLAQVANLSARLDHLERSVPGTDENERQFATPDFAHDGNPISRAIMSMRAEEKSRARLTLQDYKNCFGLHDVWTEDDRFLAYVYRSAPLAHPWITTLPK